MSKDVTRENLPFCSPNKEMLSSSSALERATPYSPPHTKGKFIQYRKTRINYEFYYLQHKSWLKNTYVYV